MRDDDGRSYEVKRVLLNNLRPLISERFSRPRRQPASARRPGMSPQHLIHIRMLPCTVCYERQGIQAHHLKSGPARSERGVGRKATDRLALPLCFLHHADLERYGSRREFEWFDAFGIDPYDLCVGLWNRRGNPDNMAAVLEAHKRDAIRTLGERARRLRGWLPLERPQ